MLPEKYKKALSVSQMISEANGVFKDNFSSFAIIALLFFMPAIYQIMYLGLGPQIDAKNIPQEMLPQVGLLGLMTLVLTFIVLPAAMFVAKEYIQGKEISVGEAFSAGLKKSLALLWTTIVNIVYALPLFILFIIPGVIYSCYWIFTSYVAVLTDKKGGAALDESKRIVYGRWWEVFMNAFVISLLAMIIMFVTGFVLGLIQGFGADAQLINLLLMYAEKLVTMYIIVIYTVFFLNFSNNRTA